MKQKKQKKQKQGGRLLVTVSSENATRLPKHFRIRKFTIALIAVFLLGSFGTAAYIGYGALTATGELQTATDELKVLMDQQYRALQENAGQIDRLNQNQQQIVERIEGLQSGDPAQQLSFLDEPTVNRALSGEASGVLDSEPVLNASTQVETVRYRDGSVNGRVRLLDWFKSGEKIMPRHTQAVVIDVETGLSFNIRRFGGTFHADSEPLTREDTAIMKEIAGGKWTWDRRAIWVKIGSRYYAASMHSMPHMTSPIKTNGFSGHFCIHFLHSMVHATDRECPKHQEMVMKAFTSAQMLDDYLLNNKY